MKIERRKPRNAEVYTASLNDIMFFLMLFFLIIATMIAPATMKVVLPSSKTSSDAAIRNQINLTVTADLKYFVEDREVTLEQIEPIIAQELEKKKNKETIVLLHAPNCGNRTSYNDMDSEYILTIPIHNIGFFNFDIDFSPYINNIRRNFKYEICGCGFLNEKSNDFCPMCGTKRVNNRFYNLFKPKRDKNYLDNVL